MKRKLLLILLAALTVVLCFTACDGTTKKEVSALTVVEGTLKTEYYVGDVPNFQDLKAVVTYSDGTAETVGSDKLTVGSLDTTSAGTKSLKIKFSKFEISVEITVSEKPNVPLPTEIKIVESGLKGTAVVGEVYDASAIQVEVTFSDGSVKILGKSDLQIILPDTSTAGEKTLTVKYKGLTDTMPVVVSAVSSLQLVSDSIKNEIFVGETFDTSALSVIVSYTNAPSEIIGADKLQLGTIDTKTAGVQYLTITYSGFTIEYKVTVVGIESVKINTATVPSKIKVMSDFDVSGLTATLKFTNGKEQTLRASELTVEAPNTTSAGIKTLKVSYGELSDSMDITILGVKSMAIVTGSLKNEMIVGEQFTSESARVSVVYTDDSTEIVGADKLNFGKLDSSTEGVKTVSVTYLDGAMTFNVEVFGVESLRVDGISKVVVAGEKLDISAMKVYAVYGDSKKTEVLITEGYTTNIDSLDFNVEGDKNFVVTYGELEASVVISTTEPELIKIEVRTYDALVGIGREYNKSSVTVIAYYGNNTTEIISTGITVGDVLAVAGEQSVSISYTEGDVTAEASIAVTVLPIKSITVSGLPEKVDIGEALDTDSVKLTVVYSDGENELTAIVEDDARIEVTPLDTATAGTKSVEVKYLGQSVTKNIYVRGVLSIKIMAGTVASVVRYGYAVDTKNLEIAISYTDNTTETALASKLLGVEFISDNTATENATASFTVKYKGVSDTMTVEVLKLVSISALNGTVPVSVIKDSAFPYSRIRLTTVYVNANNEELIYLIGLDDEKLTVSDFSTATAGEKALVFSFMGKETTVRVMVNGIENLSVVPGTLQTVIGIGQTLETGELRIRVQYTDGTYTYVDTTSIYLSIGAIDTSAEGTKILKIKYQETELDVEILVKNVSVSQDNMIFGVTMPDSLVARDAYKNNFKVSTDVYYVGSNNPYIFYLNLLILDENDEIVDVDGKTFPSIVRVFEGETELTGAALDAIVTVDAENNSYQFKPAAVGGTFTLVVRPDGLCADEEASTRRHTVKVVDAYNVYTAKELNVMTNVDEDLNGGAVEGYLSQLEAVNKFLAENGIVRPENLKGIVIHNNIDVKLEDIPAEYIYRYKRDGADKIGFYDHHAVFNHKNSDASPNFTMYGNYYSIFSYNLPCVVENGVANNDDAFSSSELFKFSVDRAHFNASFDHTKYKTDVISMAFRDNDPNSNDQAASEKHMRGLTCIKVNSHVVNINNCNIDAFMVSMIPEYDDLTLNISNSKFYNAWQGHLFVWNGNLVQEYYGDTSSTREGHKNMKIFVDDSLLAKCGGPVILVQNEKREYACNADSRTDIVVNGDSELYSYVTGQEAWFVAVGQTALAAQILGMNNYLTASAAQQGLSASYTTNTKIEGVTTINLILANMGTGTTLTQGERYEGTYTENGVVGLNMTNNPWLETYNAALKDMGAPPVFQSSAGGTCFTDNASGVYGLETGTMGAATANCFEGKYITLYYMGIGIMLEYYH
ncbi:MAG: bacterial Ig-like domain-containing protein [Clostridia bacterium]|nr:bacterial Ig-like domain-containing protein [Clostridia bacterium]